MMTSELRHTAIIDLLKQQGKAKVEELSERLSVSEVTIRKDLTRLEEQGLLERIHGSAIISQRSRFNIAFLERLRLHAPAKALIAQAAASRIQEGDSIILDAGTTTLSLARALAEKRYNSLLVMTSSMPAALELSKGNHDILLVGGQVRNHSLALIGPMTIKNLANYHADRAFIGTSGISLTHGYSTPNALDAQVKEAMIRSAEETYVLADSSKFGHDCLVSFASIAGVHLVITDSGIPAEYIKEFRKRGIRYQIAGC
ncbi:MAG TPA: DeoR/GlpR family DNA-binding transcription regulator [Chthoniobacterales bacterium]|jgi:DeoR family transcriptional regulator of aga operon/DeoR family fructose operon transcriptional repressor|nr:DeoR/GlpR family DNA-binding transcription regulator [Chthoniobacterales bacterium]